MPTPVVDVQITVYEGYADQIGPRSESLEREYTFDAMPRIGERVELGGHGDGIVEVVWWDFRGHATIRLSRTFSLAEPFDEVIARLKTWGWS